MRKIVGRAISAMSLASAGISSLIGRAALPNVVNEPRAVSLQWRVGSIRVLARGSVVGSAHACARAASSSHTSGQS